ncbi:gamma-glutamylcyclotransferase family protein [Planotetraspora sp. GP83]|uniref:gamma-glutamylcyclotransferase family protein n=1 Tax=Planotetraspora sp. GP83 TaxID=3156264 RepID=UPI0035163951
MTSPDESTTYYFGYGTLLGTDEMRKYCPGAEKVAVASFPGHRLEFWAYDENRVGCHLAEAPGTTAYGVVYRVPDSEMADLDRASGVGNGWFRRLPIDVTTVDGVPMVVTTYFLTDPLRPATPDDAYVGLVREGSRSAGLPEDFVVRLNDYLDALPPRTTS